MPSESWYFPHGMAFRGALCKCGRHDASGSNLAALNLIIRFRRLRGHNIKYHERIKT